MIRDAINKILELAPPTLREVTGRTYSNMGLQLIKEPLPGALIIHTLSGLVDYIKVNLENDLKDHHVFIHVATHYSVDLLSGLNDSADRKVFVTASLNHDHFPFGRWLDLEAFIIRLQASFVQDQNTQDLLKLLSNVKDEHIKTSQDDGISQSVTVKTGPALVQEKMVPNPVILRPYRTFTEVEQPASPFVFRLQKEGALVAALFEADGGHWKLEAISSIKEFLEEELESVAPFSIIA